MAEGGGLLNRYTVQSRIKGSNPFLSAIALKLIELLPDECQEARCCFPPKAAAAAVVAGCVQPPPAGWHDATVPSRLA